MEGAPTGTGSLASRKDALRRRMRRVRASIPAARRSELAEQVAERLFDLPEVAGAHSVMLFASFGAEVPTEDIVRRFSSEGRTVLLPFVADGELGAARFRPGDPTTRSPFGPEEPAVRLPVDPGTIDVIVLPGLAFDRGGRRLGHGGAHYDRYLSALRGAVARVGIAFHQQLVEEVPAGVRDEPVDVVVTDREVIRVRPAPPT